MATVGAILLYQIIGGCFTSQTFSRELKIGFGWANSLMVADLSGKQAVTVQNAVTSCAKRVAKSAA